jgi:hypothetical protein
MDVHIDVKGVRQVGIRFAEFPDDLYDALKQEVDALTTELFARIEAATPSLTGRLRSEERARLFTDEHHIKGYVDIAGAKGSQDFAKAAALEYSAHGAAKVSSHSMQLDHYWANKLGAPVTVMVESFTRTANIAEHAFERGPLAAMQPEVLARLNAVVEKSVAKANGEA